MPSISLAPVVKLDGQHLGDEWSGALLEVKVEAEYMVPARATLRFLERDVFGHNAGELFIDGETLKLGTEVEVAAKDPTGGTASDTVLFKGEITSIGATASSDRAQELLLVAHDKSHRLSRGITVTSYASTRISDIVASIASAAGLQVQVDSTTETYPWMLKPVTDMEMLTELARRVGFDWWVHNEKLHFAKPAQGTVTQLELGMELTSFSIRAGGHHPDKVHVTGWDPATKARINGVSSTPTSAAHSDAPLVTSTQNAKRAFGAAVQLDAGSVPGSQDEATTVSQAALDRAMAASVLVRGACIDRPSVTLGTTVHISGVGRRLQGHYPVTAVEHVWRAGMSLTTRFSAGDRGSHSVVDTLRTSGASAGAFRGQGLFIGLVTNNNDEQKLGRVKVKIPALSEEVETSWARVLNFGAGGGRGGGFQPEVNDEVLVGFEGGDPRRPVVIGGLFNSKDVPPVLKYTAAGRLAERTITSRKGHVFSILEGDDDDDPAFLLKLAGDAATLKMAKSGATLELPQGKPITIKSGSSSITLANSGDITIKADQGNLSLKAAAGNVDIQGIQVKVAASAALSLAGQAQAELKGAMVTVQSDGITAVKGSMVQIN